MVVWALLAVLVAAPFAATLRSVYVAATAQDGSPLASLSPSDVIVREGDQRRQVLSVELSRTPLRVAVVVEELLTPDNEVRRAVANFIDLVRETGDVALYTVGRRMDKRIDYTSNIVALAAAINKFPVRAVDPGDIVLALHEVAQDQRRLEGRHVIIVVATETAQVSAVTADAVLERLTSGRGVLYAATVAGSEMSTIPQGMTSGGRRLDLEGQVSGLERDRLFSSGTRQSGGAHLSSPRTSGLWSALGRVAAELRQQYVISYEGGMTADGSLTIETTRRDLLLRAPVRVK